MPGRDWPRATSDGRYRIRARPLEGSGFAALTRDGGRVIATNGGRRERSFQIATAVRGHLWRVIPP